MHAPLKKAAALAALTIAAATLAGCVVSPAPYYGDGYYAEPSPVYVAPRYYGYYGSRRNYWHHNRWHGGGWHGRNHDWD
jgi:hypothetical protein